MFCDDVGKTTLQDTSPGEERLDLPEGVPPLTSLYLYIAGSCNLACRHCWITPTYQASGNGGQFIKLEYVEKAIREAKPLGLHSVKLTGGEPTLHPQFREIVALISGAALDIIIETNGILIDTSLANYLKQQRTCFISVSLDGATAQTHEALRLVEGSFTSAVAGIHSLVGAGFQPQLICTLHRGNISEIEAIIGMAEQMGCGSVKFNHVQHIGRGELFADKNGLEVPELVQTYRRIEGELTSRYKIPIHFDIPFAFYSIRKLMDDSLGRCTVKNILSMLAGGELSLCGIGVTIPELLYGHIEQDNLRDVWCKAPGLTQLRELIPSQLEGICSKCLHRDLCQGECVANNFHASGRLNTPYSFCDQAETLCLFPVSRIIGVTNQI